MAGGESQKGSESGNKVQGARRGAGCGEGKGEGRGPADTKLHGSIRLRRGEGRGRLIRPRGGERGVPGVPGAERDIPGGGETVRPMKRGGAQGQVATYSWVSPGGMALLQASVSPSAQ